MTGTLPRFALSIRQPWAWAIIHAGKDVENRTWSTRFRGPVCIHAAAGMTRADLAEASAFMAGLGVTVPHSSLFERGGVIGTAEIVDCVRASPSPWFFGPYGFILRNARPVPFIPRKGKLGFFDWGAPHIGGCIGES